MHEVGQKVLEGLRSEFPDTEIDARERDYGTILGVSFKHEARRFLLETPEDMDYRAVAYQVWLHRSAQLIRQKTGET